MKPWEAAKKGYINAQGNIVKSSLRDVVDDEQMVDILANTIDKPLARKGYGEKESEHPRIGWTEPGVTAIALYSPKRDAIGINPKKTGHTAVNINHELRHRGANLDHDVFPMAVKSTKLSANLYEEVMIRYLDLLDAHETGNKAEVDESVKWLQKEYRRWGQKDIPDKAAFLTRAKGVRKSVKANINARKADYANPPTISRDGRPFADMKVNEELRLRDVVGFPWEQSWPDPVAEPAGKEEEEPYTNPSRPKVKGLTEEQTAKLVAAISFRESSDIPSKENSRGYLGLYQFGAQALADINVVDRAKYDVCKKTKKKGESQKAFLKDEENWNYEGGKKAWLKDTEAQHEAMRALLDKNYGYLKGSVIKKGMPPEELAGWLTASHLGGNGKAKELHKNPKLDWVDGNGTKIQSYFELGKKALAEEAPATPQKQSTAPTTPATTETAMTKLEDGTYQDDAGSLFIVKNGEVNPYV